MNLPTIATFSRLFIAPVILFAFPYAVQNGLDLTWLWVCAVCVLLIEVSDAIDGALARGMGLVTDLGKIFDPICDSLSRQTVILSFVAAGMIPFWMFLIFLYRDGLMSLLRIMSAADGTVLAAKKSGKLKAVFQALGIAAVVTVTLLRGYGVGIPEIVAGRHIAFWIMLFPALFTAVSLFDYYIPNWHVVKSRMQPK